jgi:hypothetical protein
MPIIIILRLPDFGGSDMAAAAGMAGATGAAAGFSMAGRSGSAGRRVVSSAR